MLAYKNTVKKSDFVKELVKHQTADNFSANSSAFDYYTSQLLKLLRTD